MKQCSKCETYKEVKRFKPDKRLKSGIGSWCYDCINADRKNKHSHYRKVERVRELKKYGLTTEAYELMFKEQKGKCAVCKKDENYFKRKLHVDHDHATGKVRALLCSHCNTVLGKVNDSPQLLEELISYLIRHRSAG